MRRALLLLLVPWLVVCTTASTVCSKEPTVCDGTYGGTSLRFEGAKYQVNLCAQAFLIIQAHHDYCPHDTLTRYEEALFHHWESKCHGCSIERKYDALLKDCPRVDCTDTTVARLGYEELNETCTAADTSLAFEWAASFDTPADSYTWVSQAATANASVTSGYAYADAEMKFVAFKMTSNLKSELFGLKDAADTLMSGSCPEATTITPTPAGACITMKFPNSSASLVDFTATINTAGMAHVGLFTGAHVPTEFERDTHYLMDAGMTAADMASATAGNTVASGGPVEPVNQLGASAGHGHGRRLSAVGRNDRRSRRRLANPGSCCNTARQQGAWKQVVTYHDQCEHDQVPEYIEVGFHDYEASCENYFCNSFGPGIDQTVCEPSGAHGGEKEQQCSCAQHMPDHPFKIDCDDVDKIREATASALDSMCRVNDHTGYEWGGAFSTPDDAYKWVAQANAGPAMKLVVFNVHAADKEHLLELSEMATTLMAGTCSRVSTQGTILAPTPAGACYTLTFPTDPATTDFHATVTTTGVANVAFFAEHVPPPSLLFMRMDLVTNIEPAAETDPEEYNCRFLDSLSGSLPTQLGTTLSALTELSLPLNKLSGSLPTQLGLLTKLRVMRLHENSLSGSLPTQLGTLSALLWMELQDNFFSGTIPLEMPAQFSPELPAPSALCNISTTRSYHCPLPDPSTTCTAGILCTGSAPPSSAATPPAQPGPSSTAGGNGVIIAAAASCGGVVVLVLILVGAYSMRKKRQRQVVPQTARNKHSEVQHNTPIVSLSSYCNSTVPNEALASAEATTALPLVRVARDAQKHRAAMQLLETWKLSSRDLWFGEKLGSGGQADVFAGRWQGLSVAIKMQRGDKQMNQAAQHSIEQTVRREVRALARVCHPNVIRLYGACMEPAPCIVMALASHGSLEEAVREGRISSVPDKVKLLAGIACGMEAVHAHNVIHLDLKPENVLLGADNVPLVTDFGLSTSSNLASMSNSSVGARGTLFYKAPEMFKFPPDFSAAADVYSYGVLAWVVCTHEQPYRGLRSPETAMADMLAQGVRPELPGGNDWRDTTTPGLSKLIEACWVQDQVARPTFGGEQGVVARLSSIESGLLEKDDDSTIETMLARVLAAESEKLVTATLIEEYNFAGVAAAGHEKVELAEERKGLETTQAGIEARSAAAQAVLKEGGHNELLLQLMDMVQRMSASLEQVKKDVKSATVTLGSLAMGELDCPRLVFIMPHTPPDQRSILHRLSKIKLQEKHRLIFLDPVTGSAMRCGADGLGYTVQLPSQFLTKHASEIKDGLRVVKLLLSIGSCTGLPGPWAEDLVPREVVSKQEALAVQAFEALLKSALLEAPEIEGAKRPLRTANKDRGRSWRSSNTATTATGKAYRALQQLVEHQCNDPLLLQCGLEKVKAEDGSVEWVAPESKERFIKEGAACLIWNAPPHA